jgi:hypothetical protein
MTAIANYISDNAPLLFVYTLVASISGALLAGAAAYIHAGL